MPDHPDAIRLLRELRPDRFDDLFDAGAPAARAGLERILAAAPSAPPPQPRRHPARRLAVVGGATVTVAVGAVALSPVLHGSTDVVARAAAALNPPDTILHLTAQVRDRDSAAELRDGAPDDHVDHTTEVWQTAGARQERVVYDGVDESIEDWDTQTALAYNAQRNELIRQTDPKIFDPAYRAARGTDSPSPAAVNPTDDLARLLDRARDGDDSVHLTGETTIRGIPSYELRIDFTIQSTNPPAAGVLGDPSGLATKPVRLSRLVYVDRESFLPVRIVELGPGEVVSSITDYVGAERVARTPENEHLLQMSPHPGARQVVAGRF